MTQVFLSYAQEPDDPAHQESVLRFWEFLRSCGIEAELDLGETHERRDWALWMAERIREADYVLVLASPAYRRGAEGRGGTHEERGVQWEARLIRDAFYADRHAVKRFVPVLLPGRSADGVPDFLAPATSTVYPVTDFTVEGAEKLLRMLTNQPEFVRPPLGAVPALVPRPAPSATPGRPPAAGIRNEITGDVHGFVLQVGNAGSVTTHPPGPQVGEGADPRTARAFKAAFRRAADHLAPPAEPAFPEGPGFVQHFTGEGDTVICAVTGKPAVVVVGQVWDDLETLPGFPDGPGFPTADYTDCAARVVGLDGGTWGAGTLLRDTEPRWQPRPRLSMEAREAFRLPVARPAGVTVRAIATLPWQLDDLEITRRTREWIEAALPQAEISLRLPAWWDRASGPDVRQTARDARYDQTDGGLASVRLMLPGILTSAITVSVEVRADPRITANEIVEWWTAAWDTATVTVPGALVPDPERAPLLAPPTVELHVETDGLLLDVLDLSVFGTSEGQAGREGAVTVVAPIGFGRDERWAWAAKALTRLARAWGFVDADESDLRRRSRP